MTGQVKMVSDMLLEIREAVGMFGEHAVHRSQYRRGVTPRLVLRQMMRAEFAFQKSAHIAEQARIGATEAVDGLLGVAHHKHCWPRVHCRRCGEPRLQYLPLQRVGVLEFVQQHVAVAAIQLVLHVLGAIALVEHAAHLPFQIGEIHLLLSQFQFLIMFQQRCAAMQRRLVHAQRFEFGKFILRCL